jgi:hypothetical protein
MRWIGRLIGLIGALAGLAAAQVFVGPGQAMVLPPAPTISVPALPTPAPVPALPVPVPTPPPVAPAPSPAPPPVVVPAVSAPAIVPRVAAAAPAAAPVVAAAPSSPSSSSYSTAGSAGPAASSSGQTTSRPAAGKRSDRLEAKTRRSKNRVSVRLEFTLPEAKRVFLIVRGPAPSCRIVGVIPFRGRKGENAASFAGRVGERTLEPGIYLLTISPKPRPTPGAQTEYARVASPRRTVPLAESARKPRCTLAQTLAASPTARFLSNEPPMAAPSFPTLRPAVPAAPLRPPLGPAPQPLGPDEDDGGVLGALPSPAEIGTAARDSSGEAIATLVIVLIAGLLLMGMLGLVARFMRGSWNP